MSHRTYQYKAVDGQGKVANGQISADSQAEAASQLQQRGLTPLRISPIITGHSGKAASRSGVSRNFRPPLKGKWQWQTRPASNRDLVMFCQDLSALLDAGVPLPRALRIVADLVENKRFERVLLDLHEQLKQGSTFWHALERHATVFSPVFTSMVKAGEAGGVLSMILARLGGYLDGVQQLRDYLRSAMMYPLFLLLTSLASVVVLLTVVVPKFSIIFSDMGVALPLSTRILLVSGNFLQSYGWLLCVLAIVSIFLVRFYARSATGRCVVDHLKLRLPGLGRLTKRIEITRFCRTFGTLLGSGIPILTALQMVRDVVSNSLLKESLEGVYQRLKQGGVLSEALAATGFFPPMAVQMAAIGEETGRMDTMLIRIADLYDREVKVVIKSFTSLFEPLIILLMGLLIGAMVISMLLAIFSINDMGF